ncbi:MAG: phenylalanine--tRNA ligase subunit alpha, partial [Pyrobaculum sp.]
MGVPPPLFDLLKKSQDWRLLEEVAEELGVPAESLMRHVEEGRARGLLLVERKTAVRYDLTEEGRRWAVEGLPEYKILRSAQCRQGRCVASLDQPEGDIAAANLAKLGARPRGRLLEIEESLYWTILQKVEERQRALADLQSAPPEVIQ